MKIVVITGEESGDKLAALAIKELTKISNEPLKKRVFKNILIYQKLT